MAKIRNLCVWDVLLLCRWVTKHAIGFCTVKVMFLAYFKKSNLYKKNHTCGTWLQNDCYSPRFWASNCFCTANYFPQKESYKTHYFSQILSHLLLSLSSCSWIISLISSNERILRNYSRESLLPASSDISSTLSSFSSSELSSSSSLESVSDSHLPTTEVSSQLS